MRLVSLTAIWHSAARIYSLVLFVYVVLSWLQGMGSWASDLRRLLAPVCEPYLGLFRRVLPPAITGASGLDFSPLVALLVLQMVIAPLVGAILSRVGL